MMFAHVSACNLDNLLLTNPWKFPRLFFILIWFPFPIPCIHFTDFKIKPETEMIWMNLMKIWLLATNWLEMKWTMVVLSITPQWHSSYFFNVFFLRKCNLTCKVKILWGGHIIWKKLPHWVLTFTHIMSKPSGRFLQILVAFSENLNFKIKCMIIKIMKTSCFLFHVNFDITLKYS